MVTNTQSTQKKTHSARALDRSVLLMTRLPWK
jgi:hypothetical protein